MEKSKQATENIMQKPKLIFITGATTSGKSDLALFIAKKFNGEIINADSRQVYKYLDIGSGKFDSNKYKIDLRHPSKIKINNIVHYLFSTAHPLKNYSLGRWLKDTHKAIREILKKDKLPILCGGTILYLKAIKEGWQIPKVKPNYKLRRRLENKSCQELYQEIIKIDPERSKKLDPNNKRRLIRALEIISVLGKVPPLRKEKKYDILVIAPKIDKEKLFKKIEKRLKKRVPGIIKEIKKLRKIGLSFKRIINFGLEYKWFGLYLLLSESRSRYLPIKTIDKKIKEENLKFNKIKKITKDKHLLLKIIINKCYKDILRFAKKQIRELNKIKDIIWVENKKSSLKIVEKFLKNK